MSAVWTRCRVDRSCLPLALLSIALLVSACGGGGGSGNNQPQPQRGGLQFEATSLEVNEDASTATLTITRTGGSDGAVSVAVTSKDGSATAAQDYTATSTTVNFPAGDAAAKTVTVQITEDSAGEADETLTVTLSAPTGGATVGAAATVTLTIRDNDPPSAPVLTVAADIKQLVFSWAGVPGATSYRLKQNPDGASGFTQVGADHAATATSARLDIAVHRHDWVNALYLLEACNARGCSTSGSVSALNAMLKAIGYFKASNPGLEDEFGSSVALSDDGNTLAVGAPFEGSGAKGVNPTGPGNDQNNDSAPLAGAVYVFTRDGLQWTQQAYVKASNTDPGDFFGFSLALSGDGNTLAVGATGEASAAIGVDGQPDLDIAPGAGAVYVFTRGGTQWTQQAYVKASNTGKGDSFGASVALSADGNTMAVGAPFEDSGVSGNPLDNSADNAGAVYVFTRDGVQWSQQPYVKASNADPLDIFGVSLALSADGNTLAVGAPFEDSAARGVNPTTAGNDQNDDSASNAGAVYVFTRDDTHWTQQAYVKASNTGLNDFFGNSVALSADGNTLAAGATGEDSGATGVDVPDSGAVYVFTRDNTQWSQQDFVKSTHTETQDQFGRGLALSADGNTLAVAALGENSSATGVNGAQGDNNAVDSGAVYVFTHGGMQWSRQAYVKASNTGISDQFGASVALSDDGSTLAVGAIGEDSSTTGVGGEQTNNSLGEAGAVYLY